MLWYLKLYNFQMSPCGEEAPLTCELCSILLFKASGHQEPLKSPHGTCYSLKFPSPGRGFSLCLSFHPLPPAGPCRNYPVQHYKLPFLAFHSRASLHVCVSCYLLSGYHGTTLLHLHTTRALATWLPSFFSCQFKIVCLTSRAQCDTENNYQH